jgi:hypothetical protein
MNEENMCLEDLQVTFSTTTIKTKDGVWVRTDDWESTQVWLELELDNGSFHVIMTPNETIRVIKGLQKILDLIVGKERQPTPRKKTEKK